MSGKFFLDTNIFIYSFDETEPEKCRIAETLIGRALQGEGCISSQVAQEALHVLTRKIVQPLELPQARVYFYYTLRPLCQVGVDPSLELLHESLSIQERYRYGLYDSLIIAAALNLGCTVIYSEDMHHGQRIEGLRIVNPFMEVA